MKYTVSRCSCFHVLSRHNSYGCRYCKCALAPAVAYEQGLQHVIRILEDAGDLELVALLRPPPAEVRS